MAFSSNPPYLDSSNWRHEHQNHQVIGSSNTNPLLTPTAPPQPAAFTQLAHGSSGTGSGSSVRPGSMSERARMANIPIPETSLKCPRCESTNTKFCYFNNYNLSQPRHFCKNCRRYWTRGGALRSVPIGGGCRRNKRCTNTNKSTTSKLIPPSQNISTSRNNILSTPTPQAFPPPLRFMSPLGMQFTENFSNNIMGNFINYSGVTGPMVAGTSNNIMTQFPFLSSLDTGINYPFHEEELEFLGGSRSGGGEGNQQHQVRPKFANSVTMSSHFAAVKSERNGEMNNLSSSRELLDEGIPEWAHLSSFSSSIPATTSPL